MTQPEKSFLESLMHRPDLWHSMAVRPKHLSSGVAVQVYEAIGRAVKDGLSMVSVADLRALDAKIPLSVIGDLQPFTSALWERHQEAIIDQSGRRALATVPAYLADVLDEKSASEAYYSLLGRLSEHFADDGGTWYGQLRDSLDIDGLREQMERYRKGELPGLSCGLEQLDDTLSGLQPGMMYVVAARPSGGKSALLGDIAMRLALGGHGVGFISIESGRDEIAKRMLARQSHVPLDEIIKGSFSDAAVAGPFQAAFGKMMDVNFVIYDKPNATVKEISIIGQRMRQADSVKAIFIDYLQNVQATNPMEQRYRQVAEISMGLKQMARELNIPVIIGAQMTRESEQRKGDLPKLSDLGESSQIEKDADAVIMLHNTEGTEGYTKFCLKKNRHGETKVIKAVFNKPFMSFEEREWSDVKIGGSPNFS